VVKGVIDDFYSFAAQETRKVSTWSDFCASMIDQRTQTADIADFRQKRRAAIVLELGKKRSRTGDCVGNLVVFFVFPEFSIKVLSLPGVHGNKSTICIHVAPSESESR
jgi:hypothetical protein